MSCNDAFTWGQRTQADADYMIDEVNRQRLGDMLPPTDGTGGLEDDWPNVDSLYAGPGYMGNKDLERFVAHDDCGTSVKPMYDNQATYANYGAVKHGYERKS